MRDRLYVTLQRLLPARLAGRIVYRLSRSRHRSLKNLLIRVFVRLYRIDVTEAEHPVPDGYATFNAFFTRKLAAGARSFDPRPTALCSPVDGTIQQLGSISGDRILQAKGITYSLAQLLADPLEAQPYHGGQFITVYLAPRDYHCVHAPTAAKVRKMVHVPGRRLAVNRTTAAVVQGLFCANERLICHCESRYGPFALVMVGAMNVASLSTSWSGEVPAGPAGAIACWDYPGDDRRTRLAKGDAVGRFNLGSTVLMTLPPGAVAWLPQLAAGDPVRLGTAIGYLSKANGNDAESAPA